jgi:hypothetical protein
VASTDGLPAVQFYDDSTAKLLSISDATSLDYTDLTIYSVFKRAADLGANERIFGKFSVGSPANQREFSMLVMGSAGDVFQIATSSNGTGANGLGGTTKVISTGTNYIGHGCFNNNNGDVRVNNEDATKASGAITGPIFQGTSPVHIGARDGGSEPFSGYIRELLLFTRALTSAENLLVLNYLSKRWNIALA